MSEIKPFWDGPPRKSLSNGDRQENLRLGGKDKALSPKTPLVKDRGFRGDPQMTAIFAKRDSLSVQNVIHFSTARGKSSGK